MKMPERREEEKLYTEGVLLDTDPRAFYCPIHGPRWAEFVVCDEHDHQHYFCAACLCKFLLAEIGEIGKRERKEK